MIHCNNCYILSAYCSDINDLTCDRCNTRNCLRCTFVLVTNNKIINRSCVKCFGNTDCSRLNLRQRKHLYVTADIIIVVLPIRISAAKIKI